MISQSIEAQYLHRIADDYQRRGYNVFIEPRDIGLSNIPSDWHLDLLAQNDMESVVVEISSKYRLENDPERLTRLAEAIEQKPDWRLELVMLPSDEAPETFYFSAPDDISVDEFLQQANQAAAESFGIFIILWNALESVLREYSQKQGIELPSKHSTPALIKKIYSESDMEEALFQQLLHVASIRNAVVHGHLAEFDPDLVQNLRFLIDTLRD